MTISGASYVNFMAQLQPVASERQVQINKKGLGIYEKPESRAELIESMPDTTLFLAAKKAKHFVKDHFVKHEAAKRSNNPELAALFLSKWTKDTYNTLPWEEIVAKLEAETLVLNDSAIDVLLNRLEQKPSIEAVKMLLTINSEADQILDEKLYASLFALWEKWDATSPDQLEFGKYLTRILMARTFTIVDVDEELATAFCDFICGRINDNFEGHSAASMAKNRILLRELQHTKHFVPLYLAAAKIKTSITELCAKLNHYSHWNTAGSNIQQMEYLQEIYVHLSQMEKVETDNFYEQLDGPEHSQHSYRQIREFMIACGFVFKQHNRELFLKNLKQMCHTDAFFPKPEPTIPLAKLMLGVMTVDDVPNDKNSLLTPLFVSYRGIIHEAIDDSLKVALFEDLVNGKLGGYTPGLIGGLVAVYGNKEHAEIWRSRALQALASLAAFQWMGPNTGINCRIVIHECIGEAREAMAKLRPVIAEGLLGRDLVLNKD